MRRACQRATFPSTTKVATTDPSNSAAADVKDLFGLEDYVLEIDANNNVVAVKNDGTALTNVNTVAPTDILTVATRVLYGDKSFNAKYVVVNDTQRGKCEIYKDGVLLQTINESANFLSTHDVGVAISPLGTYIYLVGINTAFTLNRFIIYKGS